MPAVEPTGNQTGNRVRTLLWCLAAAAAALGAVPTTSAQEAESPPATAPSELGEWLEVEGLGLRVRFPKPSFGKAETIDGVLRYEVVDGDPKPRWWLRFQNLTSSKSGRTAKIQLDEYLDMLKRNEKPFTLKVNEAISVKGESGESRILLLQTPVGDGSEGISGWIVIPNGPDRFLTGSIIAASATFDESWPLLRAALGTIEVKSLESVATAKKERMERGGEVLDFTRKQLREALTPEPVYYRLYRPGVNKDGTLNPAADTELGWMAVRVLEGSRNEVEGPQEQVKPHADDTDSGILAIVEAKWIVSKDPPVNTVDTQIRSWLSWDRRSEVWSARNTQRQGTAARSSAQTGVRTAAPPKLRVINATAEKQAREPQEWVVPPNYLSQTELVMLGRLLPKKNPGPITFSCYAFEAKSNGLPQRTDTWSRNDDGTWTLETRMGGSTTPLVQIFDKEGERVKRIDVDAMGTVITERVGIEELRALWKRKGLPLE